LIRSLVIVALFAATAQAEADEQGSTAFEQGLAKFQAEDFAGALPLLEQAHRDAPDDADAALLLGIAYYRTDQLALARPILEQAERDGDEDSKASARIFLGLIADEQGHDERAHVYYEQVAQSSPELGASARLLIDQAGPTRWLVVGVLRPQFDSNVELLPMTTGRGHGKGSADGEIDLGLVLRARLAERVPLVLDQAVAYDKQFQLSDYDWLSDRVGATYAAVRGRDRATLAYHFEASQLGGVKYELAHFADVAARRRLRDALAIGARYSFGVHDYGMDYAGYSGLTHTAAVQLIRGTRTTPVELAVGYEVEREGTSDSSLTMLAHGPRADLRLRTSKRTELRGVLQAQHRIYDKKRQDVFGSMDAALYMDLSTELGLVTGGSFTFDQSTSKTFSYSKWTAYLAMIVVLGE
jgi:tetratricopeptide (TPR) repeat protein